MRPFRPLPARLPIALLILVALALIGADDEAVDSWNQEKAAAAATELAASLDGLRDALRNEPSPGIGSSERPRHELKDRLRLMENESKHLAAELKDGQGRDATYPVFQRINSIRRDAVEDAQRMYLQQPVRDKIESARGPLEKLAGYYGVKLDHQLEMR
jgi:hypothetical protein